ncbi:hypothetical protein BX616_006944, partial [Lobosporangium transversale]
TPRYKKASKISKSFGTSPLPEEDIRVIVQRPATEIYPGEREEGPDALVFISESRLQSIAQHILQRKVTLLRSPPYSGKTSLGYSLRDYFIGHNLNAIYFTFCAAYASATPEDFKTSWLFQNGRTWDQVIHSEELTIVIMDDTQMVYGNRMKFFWDDLKSIMTTSLFPQVRILLLASYDPAVYTEPTPLHFTEALGMESLRMTKEEYYELVKA